MAFNDLLDEGTLVVYHGEVRNHFRELAFVRGSEIKYDDRRYYLLDTICYLGSELPWDDDQPITTFGDVWATRDEFTVVPIPEVPEPLKPGNYINVDYPWRRSSDGSWDSWLPDGTWELRSVSDADMRDAIYIGPLPKP